MSVLASLVRTYERLEKLGEVPPFGFSNEKIGFLIPLARNGSLAGSPIDLRSGEGRASERRVMCVPQPVARTSGVATNVFWDKTSYALGVTAGSGSRTGAEHAAFRRRHLDLLADSEDVGLLALRRFIETWRPLCFKDLCWPEEMKDHNVVFALADEMLGAGGEYRCIHDRPAARLLLSQRDDDGTKAVCLVTGSYAPIARIHPILKNVWNAQSSGARLVSFNLESSESFEQKQGDNAPVSSSAAFAYATVLNTFLANGSRRRFQVGDTSAVFWADASDARITDTTESLFAALVNTASNPDDDAARTLNSMLQKIRNRVPIPDVVINLPKDVRFHILGLAPNAARLSVRFYITDEFGEIVRRYLEHLDHMTIDPSPKDLLPPIWRLLVETAPLHRMENIVPKLAGDWLRAILSGAPYPSTLLMCALIRLRADHDINALRVAILKSVLIRNFRMEVPVSLDIFNRDHGYLLGRLFATFEYAQIQASPGIGTTIRDKYWTTASATPRAVFPALQRRATYHIATLRGTKPWLVHMIEQRIGEIFEVADPVGLFVPSLSPPHQALFAIGYYHQKNELFRIQQSVGLKSKVVAEKIA